MARNKHPEITVERILEVSQRLFTEKGYDSTRIQDIVNELGGLTKGAIYHHYKSKEEIMKALGIRLLFNKDFFETVKGCNDLSALKKIQEILVFYQANAERISTSSKEASVLTETSFIPVAVEMNRELLTPLWLEIIEEGINDGSIKTEYAKELSEILPLLNFWLLPSVYPDTAEELRHKFYFVMEMLTKMGLPVLNKDMKPLMEKHLKDM